MRGTTREAVPLMFFPGPHVFSRAMMVEWLLPIWQTFEVCRLLSGRGVGVRPAEVVLSSGVTAIADERTP